MARWLTLLQGLVVAAMFVAAATMWPIAPENIPVHFGLSGEPNRYGGKVEGLLVLPLIALGVLVLLKVLPLVDPRRARYAEFATAYAVLTLAIVVFFALVYAFILAAVLGIEMNATIVIVPLVGLLLIVIGAVLGQVRPNWFVGIRTPWTLSSEHAWIETHRAGRWVFVGMGALLIIAGLLQFPWLLSIAIAGCVLGALGLVLYSYLVWRDDQRGLA
jgi:immunity protein, SdpI family